jgi:putative membrane-bound dehydrogenase-like protein
MRSPLPFLASAVLFVQSAMTGHAATFRATGADGQPLNLGFEDGTLKDWTVAGDAWTAQPTRGDSVAKRREDMKSEHDGEFWVSSFDAKGDKGTGRLTSVAFQVTQPWASFLIGGGDSPTTRVELVEAATGQVFHTARGTQRENMARAVADLRQQQGKAIYIRVVDQNQGPWGHVNFDDFTFHDTEPKAAATPARTVAKAGPTDVVQFAGLSPEQAVKEMKLPPGFSAKLFAAEPDVTQPIAFCIDDRGRLWVAEGHTYPKRAPEGQGRDRIVVFEDSDGDGRFNRRTVFTEGLNLVSGIEVGFGGVFVGAAPNLLFIPMVDGDAPKPAGEPEILLDGWGYQDTHETLNTFTWGPDGWLYGCHGVFTHSKVGAPGTPEEKREKINAGVWRFQPIRRQFEVFSHGTSNPWGIDFDARGQCFVEACVIPHLYHMIQGGRYERQAGPHFNPYTYEDIKTVADHRHYVGGNPHAGNNRSDAAGGGHAHAGLLIYQGDSWPAEYRGRMFMNNIHGQRINADFAERKGSGFVGKHAPDFINFNDRASQILNMLSDQDGSVYMIDWYDNYQCHNPDPAKHDQSNGRIFKVVYGDQKGTAVDLTKESNEALAWLQLSPNDWRARHARRLLQERSAKGGLDAATKTLLTNLLHPAGGPASIAIPTGSVYNHDTRLRVLWTLHACGALEPAAVAQLLDSAQGLEQEYLRAWAIQLACERAEVNEPLLKTFARLAKDDPSPVVRLYLASACQRLTLAERKPILDALLTHKEDVADPNLPLMIWYAAEPIVAQDPLAAVAWLESAAIPKIREFIARRMAATAQADR